jgi:hypothetical protein
MNNTTNHINNALFTKTNEARFIKAFEKLVDHIVATQPDLETQAWLAKVQAPPSAESIAKAIFDQPITPHTPLPTDYAERIKVLERQLAEANAKLSRRF